ncbi:hypothetical protein HYH02_007951 [Chlamydomonas schloesseri]|uniref:F-ATPase protein 6 n=1 Tax=Chlamydomonas schloesseri TaxID=2026947 RepID=A0A835WHR2_9CHLO|nr:hypothetical protein HYH02_007951 [Chlamydomonas schloesseri]|eukprot:KAG2447210.1 hypothetical protein HYH02_007951 [Chlamydomonas schloesseri]
MSLQQAAPRVFGLLGRAPVALGQSGILTGSSAFKGQGFNGSLQSVENHVYAQAFSTSSQEEQTVPSIQGVSGMKLPGMAGSMLLGKSRSGLRTGSMVPFAAQQSMNMSTAAQVQSGSAVNSLLIGIYRFWRSQAPMDKPHAPVDDRMLPAIVHASDNRAALGTWATALFCTILASNLLGLVPTNEAPTSGLGFATGLGVSVWATATALGLYKLGFSFPGHFIPGGTPWPMAFIFVPLETISYTFRAVSLGVRLWVNMLAGHTLLHILTGMALALPFSLSFFAMVPATFAVACLLSALVGLEYLVAVLQSGVFSILSTVYVGEFNSVKLAGPLAKVVKKAL